MISTLATLPPAPSSAAIEAAFGLIAAASDPAGVKKRIEQLVTQTKQVHAAIDQMQAEQARLDEKLAAVEDLNQRLAPRRPAGRRGSRARAGAPGRHCQGD